MTTAVHIKDVDTALLLRYTGISIDIETAPSIFTSTDVEPFIEEPSVEEHTERVYPSVALKLVAIVPDFDRSHSDDDEEEETAYDSGQSPPVRTMRLRPHPFNLTYTLDTWHKVRAGEGRDLVRYAVIERTHPRGYIDVTNVDGDTQPCWVLWEGGVAENDELKEDLVIYHKSLTLTVQVDLLTDPIERDYKVVTDAIWRTYQQSYKLDVTGKDIEIRTGEDALFQGMRIIGPDVEDVGPE